MTRKPIKVTAAIVQTARAEWYSFHYENRQLFKALNKAEQMHYQTAAETLPIPHMTVYGGLSRDFPLREAFDIAHRQRLNIDLLNHWYISDAGWQTLQDLWQQLPEPVDFLYSASWIENIADTAKVVPTPLGTTQAVVPTIHSLSEIMPPKR